MTQLRWWSSGIAALALLAFAVFLLSADDATSLPDSASVVSDLPADSSLVASDSTDPTNTMASDSAVPSTLAGDADTNSELLDALEEAPDGPAVSTNDGDSSSSSDVAAADNTTGADPTASQAAPADSAVASPAAKGLRLRIPSLGVDALVVELGFNAQGQLAVPTDAYSVGRYTISARPGDDGNALLGGHLNWGGLRGVFDRLDELNDGDLIYVVQDGDELVFQVSRSRSVTADASLQEVLSAPAAGSTLTLFTCGGTFDRSEGEYDQRLVVNAVRVANGAG